MFSVQRSKNLRTRTNKKKAALSGLLFFLWIGCSQQSSANTCSSDVLTAIENKQLYKDPQWLRLLHFRRTFPIFQSQADSPFFFLAKDGMKNPESELKTMAKALCEGSVHDTGKPKLPKMAARCQFPVRENFILKGLGLTKAPWPQMECPELNIWRGRVDPTSLTLVFSSYYTNSPSSVFGHTLIRVNRKKIHGVMANSPLLSQGINYAAVTDTSNPLKYAIWGLIGGFPGEFASLPYFYKVREYSDSESRDLWEYDLNLTPEQLHLFVDHIWELGFTHFNYYYFNENCSYHLLASLEAVVPGIAPSETLPFWVIPADTIKAAVNTPGLVGTINYRPSVYRQFLARYEKIKNDKKMKSAFKQIVFEKRIEQVKTLELLQQAWVMDAALDYWDFKNFRDLVDQASPMAAYKQQLLGYRAKLPSTEELVFPIDEQLQPDKSHGSFRYGLGMGRENDGGFAELDLRFALHDFLDDSQGLPDQARIDFFRFRGKVFEDFKKTRLESFRFVDIQLLAPLTEFNTPVSWRFIMGAERTRHLFCDGCMAPDLLLQGGYSLDIFSNRVLVYALGGGHFYWPEGIGAQLAGQLSSGFRLKWTSKLGSLVEGEWQQALGPNRDVYRKVNFETRYNMHKDLSFGLDLMKGDKNDFQTMFKLYIYR